MSVRGLCKLPDGRDWLWVKLGLVLVGRANAQYTLIQFSAEGWGHAPSLLVFGLRQPCLGVSLQSLLYGYKHHCKANGNLLQEDLCHKLSECKRSLSLWKRRVETGRCSLSKKISTCLYLTAVG